MLCLVMLFHKGSERRKTSLLIRFVDDDAMKSEREELLCASNIKQTHNVGAHEWHFQPNKHDYF